MGKRIAGRSLSTPLSDRERILMTIIDRLSSTATLRGMYNQSWSSEHYRDGDGFYVHFAPWKKPQKGDLVLARTGHVSEWKIGWYVEPLPNSFGGAVIRELGGDKLCNYGNESFEPIVGLENNLLLLEGDQYQFLKKVHSAFAKGDEYCYRFGGLRFDGDFAVIKIREAFGGFGKDSVPFEVSLKWSKRMAVKAVLKAMRDGGYGTKSFRPEQVALNGS